MERVKKCAKIWLCIAIVLMLLGSAVASVIQSDGGKVTIKELEWETDNGIKLSSFLYVPENATAETPAPAIVTSHGAFNNKEMQDANLIELARRGYVVLASDQPQHGNSDLLTTDGKNVGNSAVYQGVLMVSRLPYVDTTRIGVTGHSMGGMSCNSAIMEDNAAEKQLISAILINSADATYVNSTDAGLSDTTEGEYANIYGSRDVGMISCVFDEFFNKSTDANGEQLSSPYFMESSNAQSFLYFGQDPEGLDTREAFAIYREKIDGEEAIRVIYRPTIIHPWSHFSARSTEYTIEFFEEALGAPNPLPSSDQVWNIKEAFNCVALVGFAIFIASFTLQPQR